jgi:hypothetical protein
MAAILRQRSPNAPLDMRRLSPFLLLFAVSAPLGAQIGFPTPPYDDQHWSVTMGFTPIAWVSGGVSRLMNSNGEGVAMGVRRRVRESRLWLGLELEAWLVPANAAGVDWLAARSQIPNVYSGSGGDFTSSNFTLSARYDLRRLGPAVAYGLAGVGIADYDGFLNGVCTSYPDPCEHPATKVGMPGVGSVGTAGVGALIRVFKVDGIWRVFLPSTFYAEARITNQGTPDGRLTTTPFQFGFAW